jgi:hypothetical protein
MRLKDIIEVLRDTELKQIIIGEDDRQVYSLLNMALIDVYARFNILQEEQLITMEADKNRYRLYDKSQKVLQVYGKCWKDQDKEEIVDLPINDINHECSVFTPQPYVLYVPNPIAGEILSVIHAVEPPYVTKENIDTLDFLIPPQLMEPIVNYIGYRAYLSINGDQQYESTSHYQRYLRSCNDVYKRGLVHYSILTNTKTTERGFA